MMERDFGEIVASETDGVNAALRLGYRALPPPGSVVRWVSRKGQTFEVLYYSTNREWIVFRRTGFWHGRVYAKESRRVERLLAEGYDVVALRRWHPPFHLWEHV